MLAMLPRARAARCRCHSPSHKGFSGRSIYGSAARIIVLQNASRAANSRQSFRGVAPMIVRVTSRLTLILFVAVLLPSSSEASQRTTISLDGTWDIEDSKDPDAIPTVWNHKAPVPGLAHSAQPDFPHV